MNILGINYYYHDSTACIVSDGQLLVSLEEERLTRNKHTTAFPRRAIDRCIEVSGLRLADIDAVAVSIQPALNWPSKVLYGLRYPRNLKPFLKHELVNARYKQKNLHDWYQSCWPGANKPQLHFIPHHLSHAAGSFFVSPYEEAALLSIDGSGEWATSFLGIGRDREIICLQQSYFPYSMGSFYEAATEFCGFRPNFDEGKTMGLAPLGDSSVFYDKIAKILTIGSDGQIQIDLSYFNYQFWGFRRCSQKFYDTFGAPREKNGRFEEHHVNLAAAAQRVLEERALEVCDILHRKTAMDYVVISGGVSLNSVMNGRIVRESPFKDLYVMPAAGDNGTAIGAAYYLYNGMLNNPRSFRHMNPYIGNGYSNDDIRATLDECKLGAEFHEDICSVAAGLLHEGNILGWFQGNMEIGPRALGNRSILANPTLAHMKDKINAEVKHREAYRPFAPSCAVEAKGEYFEMDVEDPFMLKVCYVKPEKRAVLPAITHVDGSARLQTVRQETNPRYHELLSKFGRLSGAPVLLNTSFNIMGEPIVESPLHAIRCFFSTGLDVLVLGNYLIRKQ
jgi:carbamoyltransferase